LEFSVSKACASWLSFKNYCVSNQVQLAAKTSQTLDTLAAIGICKRGVASRRAAQPLRTFATPSRTNANSHPIAHSDASFCQHYVAAKMAVEVCSH